jgi:hypothetical protein
MAEQNTLGVSVSVGIVKDLFDAHPEDVISPINSAAEALTWLEEIFDTIKKEALDGRNGYRIQRLAAAGAYIAADMGDYADHMYKNYLERLQIAGAVASGEVASHD